ncbi:MAG: hypothetical protein GWP10_10525 [Nitrospiraceae bacterium]|nr:hypothetical protein [Nitrospiraceae bacterium]
MKDGPAQLFEPGEGGFFDSGFSYPRHGTSGAGDMVLEGKPRSLFVDSARFHTIGVMCDSLASPLGFPIS